MYVLYYLVLCFIILLCLCNPAFNAAVLGKPLIDWFDWDLIGWLIDWFIVLLIHWLIELFIDSLFYWLIYWFIDLIDCCLLYYFRSVWWVPASVSWRGTIWSHTGRDLQSGCGGGPETRHSKSLAESYGISVSLSVSLTFSLPAT